MASAGRAAARLVASPSRRAVSPGAPKSIVSSAALARVEIRVERRARSHLGRVRQRARRDERLAALILEPDPADLDVDRAAAVRIH
jgi:hypothetical protein